MENFLERAGRAGNQIAHIGQLAEHEIVQCCEQLVGLGGIGDLDVERTSPQIIHVVTFQPLVLNAACQQRNISQHRTQDILSSLKGINSLRARRKFTVSESLSCCMDNTCPVTTPLLGGNIRMITRNSPHSYQSPQLESHLARATGNSKHSVQN